MRYPYFAAYVQDDFKVNRKLSLNLGLRWDYMPPIVDANDNYPIMDPTVPNPDAGNLPGAMIFAGSGQGRVGRSRLLDKIDYKNFGPRFGLGYAATTKMAFRAAYGISYYPTDKHSPEENITRHEAQYRNLFRLVLGCRYLIRSTSTLDILTSNGLAATAAELRPFADLL